MESKEVIYMVDLIISLLLGGLVIYVVYWIIGMLAIPQQIKTVILVIIAVLALVWLLRSFALV